MAQELAGTQGVPIDEATGGGAPAGPTTPPVPQGTFVDVDGAQVSQSDLVATYQNKAKWQAANTQRADDNKRQREYIEGMEQRMQPLMELDEGFFKRYPGSEAELKQFAIDLQRKHALGTTQPAPQPGQPAMQPQPQSPQMQAYMDRLDGIERRMDDDRNQRELTVAWDTFERKHPDMTPLQRSAVRGRLPFIPSEGLNDVGMLERAYADVAQMSNPNPPPPPGAADAQRDRMAALGNVGLSPGGAGNAQPVDLSGKSLAESKGHFKEKLLRGDYTKT